MMQRVKPRVENRRDCGRRIFQPRGKLGEYGWGRRSQHSFWFWVCRCWRRIRRKRRCRRHGLVLASTTWKLGSGRLELCRRRRVQCSKRGSGDRLWRCLEHGFRIRCCRGRCWRNGVSQQLCVVQLPRYLDCVEVAGTMRKPRSRVCQFLR